MSDLLVARRYAQALYDAATALGHVDDVDRDVELIRATLDASRELVLFFESPIVSRERKERVVTALFESRLAGTTLRFMELLIQKRREDIFPQVVVAYRRLRDEHLGIVGVTVRAARSVTDEDEDRIRTALEEWTGSSVSLETRTDDSLIGGLIVRVGDMVYDGSVRNKLEHLREQFASGSFRNN